MKRGEIWTASAGSAYAGKPRPVVIAQDDRFDAIASVTACAFTTDPTDAPLFRLLVEPDEVTGIRKIQSTDGRQGHHHRRSKLCERVGQLNDDMIRLSRALVVFLGLGGT